MRHTVGILGTPIDSLNTEEVLSRLDQFIQERRFHQIATANTDFLINALHDPELRHILRNADLVVPDGMPIVWASWLMGSRLPERVTGADLVPALAARAAHRGYSLYMLGAPPEVAQRAKANLLNTHPGLRIVGCVSPPVAPLLEMETERVLEDIVCAKPDILLVAFGNPKQEKWIHLHRERLQDVPVCIGVGGTFDFLAGNTHRAPNWMRNHGMEWMHRLLQEPRRLWRRYLRDFSFFYYLGLQWRALHLVSRQGRSDLAVTEEGDSARLSLLGDLTNQGLPRFSQAVSEALNARKHLILDFQKVGAFNGETLGALVTLPRRAAFYGCDVRLEQMPPRVVNCLVRSRMHDGLYRVDATEGMAFSEAHRAGLSWQVRRAQEASIVVVSGAADRRTTEQLETVLAWLLNTRKQVCLDMRGVTYADLNLLASLIRLTQLSSANPGNGAVSGTTRLLLVPGEVVGAALRREKALAKVMVGDLPGYNADSLEALPLETTPPMPPLTA